MNATSIATNGVAGSAVLVACWIMTSRFGVVFPEYIITALVVLTVGASHGLAHLLAPRPAVAAMP